MRLERGLVDGVGSDTAGGGGTGQGACIMFRMPGQDMSFHDQIRGDLRKAAADMKDFVIVRSDGTPVFHLANVVDDITMGITHVIRGDDHIENTYRHVALYQALDAPLPRYAHLPMIVNAQGKPYSKRDGAAYVGEFRERGFHPEALFNYLSLLGWSPGDDREKLSRAELISLFTLDRVKSAAAQFDLRKLTHLNSLYVAEMPVAVFAGEVREYVRKLDWGHTLDEGLFVRVCALMQSRTPVYSAAAGWKHFFSDLPDYDEHAVLKHLRREGTRAALQRVHEALAAVSEFNPAAVEAALRGVEQALGLKPGALNQTVRVALTGLTIGAGIYETAVVLGRAKVLARLEHAITRYSI